MGVLPFSTSLTSLFVLGPECLNSFRTPLSESVNCPAVDEARSSKGVGRAGVLSFRRYCGKGSGNVLLGATGVMV